MILDYAFALNNQCKQRHAASIVHYPIKIPPRAFYCALPNQTPPRYSIVHFAAQEKKTRCFCEAYTGLPVVRATENQKALNCVVLKYSIPVSEEQQIKEKRETLASGLTC